MFWNFMHKVHNMPTSDRCDLDPGWTDEEKKKLDLINHQLSYVRLGDNVPDLPVVECESTNEVEKMLGACLGPVSWSDHSLPSNFVKFFEEHLGCGKYLGYVSVQGEIPEEQLEWEDEETGETVYIEENDVECVWVFEKGSIAYAHYGRGAGLSFRFHESLGIEGDPLEYFKQFRE